MTTAPIELPGYPAATEDAATRVRRAQAFLPRLRDLHMMKEILEHQPVFLGLAERTAEIDDEIRGTERRVIEALCLDAPSD